MQGELRSAQAEIDGLEVQLRQHRQRAEQLLSALAATADVSAPVQDALNTSEERPTAFSTAVQQLCGQVLRPKSGIHCCSTAFLQRDRLHSCWLRQ